MSNTNNIFTIESPVKGVIEKQNLIKSRLKGREMSLTQNSFDFRDSSDLKKSLYSPKTGATALLKDNPSSGHMRAISKYI